MQTARGPCPPLADTALSVISNDATGARLRSDGESAEGSDAQSRLRAPNMMSSQAGTAGRRLRDAGR
jgi:hypothetical protein